MCYDAESQLKRILKDAIIKGVPQDEIDYLKKKLEGYQVENHEDSDVIDFYHVNAWGHPKMLIQLDTKPTYEVSEWGFVHSAAKTIQESYDAFAKPWINNPNAQSETIFDKSTFKAAAINRRCIISLDSFYEHHHAKGKTFPFRISHIEGKPLSIAGIFNKNELVDRDTGEVINKLTFAILTTKGNSIMAKIHNSPSVVKRTGARMPVILDDDQIEAFLSPTSTKQVVLSLCKPYEENMLRYYTVKNLKDRKSMPYVGNVPEIRNQYDWPGLNVASILGQTNK